jgi:hypothetical protein
MKINSKLLNRIIEPALSDFFSGEVSSILNDVAERNLCARLAIHLERHMAALGLTGYYADPEYNRKQEGLVKTILSGNMEVIPITCDLIVHSRGEIPQKDNLIAIEMAKPNKTPEEFQADRNRLMALTKSSYDDVWSYDGKTHPEHVCGYVKGLYLIIDRHKREAALESYAHGSISKPTQDIRF